jgi:hypothetical protein
MEMTDTKATRNASDEVRRHDDFECNTLSFRGNKNVWF